MIVKKSLYISNKYKICQLSTCMCRFVLIRKPNYVYKWKEVIHLKEINTYLNAKKHPHIQIRTNTTTHTQIREVCEMRHYITGGWRKFSNLYSNTNISWNRLSWSQKGNCMGRWTENLRPWKGEKGWIFGGFRCGLKRTVPDHR